MEITPHLVGNPGKTDCSCKFTAAMRLDTGEVSLGHLSKTVETTIQEMKPFIIGRSDFQTDLLVTRLSR